MSNDIEMSLVKGWLEWNLSPGKIIPLKIIQKFDWWRFEAICGFVY